MKPAKDYLIAVALLFLPFFSISGSTIIDQAIAHNERPKADVARDLNRKPQAVLDFFAPKPGMTVLDVYTTDGYYTEILSRVVGAQGKVVAHNSMAYRKFMGPAVNKRYLNQRLANVERIFAHPRAIELTPNSLDMALMILIFHDLYVTNAKNLITPADRIHLLKQIYAALKPGGIVGIVDHTAPRGSGIEAATQWHRLSSSIVNRQLTALGFELVDENTSLRNRHDPHDISVFDSKIRRKTDRYVLKFRKPN